MIKLTKRGAAIFLLGVGVAGCAGRSEPPPELDMKAYISSINAEMQERCAKMADQANPGNAHVSAADLDAFRSTCSAELTQAATTSSAQTESYPDARTTAAIRYRQWQAESRIWQAQRNLLYRRWQSHDD
jgi:hypothetical protein